MSHTLDDYSTSLWSNAFPVLRDDGPGARWIASKWSRESWSMMREADRLRHQRTAMDLDRGVTIGSVVRYLHDKRATYYDHEQVRRDYEMERSL